MYIGQNFARRDQGREIRKGGDRIGCDAIARD